MNNVDLEKVVKEHYKEMVEGTYKWKDEEISALYALGTVVLKKYDVLAKDRSNYNDYLQDFMCAFFLKILPKYDPEKNSKFSTYVGLCFQNEYLMKMRRKKKMYSLDDIKAIDSTGKKLPFIDTIQDNYTEEQVQLYKENEDKKAVLKFLKEKFKDNKLITELYFKGEGASLTEVAKKLGYNPQYASRKVRKNIESVKREKIIRDIRKSR